MANPPADIAELQRALDACCHELAAALAAEIDAAEARGAAADQDGSGGVASNATALGPAAGAAQGASPVSPSWRPLVLAPLPGLAQLVGIIKPPLQVIVALLEVIAALLEALAAILIGIIDPFRALIAAAVALLRDIINDLLNTGAYMYVDVPGVTPTEVGLGETGVVLEPDNDWVAGRKLALPPRVPDGFERWATRFAASFDDPGDRNRPIVTEGAPIEAMFVVMAAPSLAGIRQAIYLLGKLFNIDQFKQAYEKYQQGSPDPRRTRARAMKGVAPDWRAVKLTQLLPPLEKLEPLPDMLLGLLSAVDGLTGLVKSLATAMQDKAKLLLQLAETIQSIIDLLDALKSSGMYILPVSTKGGVAGLRQAFVAAANRPPGGYIGGVCFLASGPNLAKAAMLWQLLGGSTMMDVAEGKLSLEDAAKQGTLGQVTQVLEQNYDNAKAEAKKFGSTVEDQARAFQQAIEDAPLGLVNALGETPDSLRQIAASSRAAAVDILDQTRGTWTYDARAIQDGIDQTRQAQRQGARSLALGLGAASGPEPEPEPATPAGKEGT